MPVGTAGSVKGMDPRRLAEVGAEIVLANTYHLSLRPGAELVERLGGVGAMMGWARPVLTDSGGYQVMSLAAKRRISDDGVEFRSHIDGTRFALTPETCLDLQGRIGSDIAMPLDVCPHFEEGERAAHEAVRRTSLWARRAAAHRRRSGQALFGIVQGGAFWEARRRSLEDLLPLPFDGYALGSFMVGEPVETCYEMVGRLAPMLPAEKPRYVMGVGTPVDLVTLASCGVDMFDTVMPTRSARNGLVFTSRGRLVIKHARHREDPAPLDPECRCSTCRRFSRAYLGHLFRANEVMAAVLLTHHNVAFYLDLMRQIRDAISAETLDRLREDLLSRYARTD